MIYRIRAEGARQQKKKFGKQKTIPYIYKMQLSLFEIKPNKSAQMKITPCHDETNIGSVMTMALTLSSMYHRKLTNYDHYDKKGNKIK